jgi:short-subunit dehydrogenase
VLLIFDRYIYYIFCHRKWAIVTGSTAGIGKEFADYLSKLGCNILLISRTESKLKEQKEEIISKYKNKVKYIGKLKFISYL